MVMVVMSLISDSAKNQIKLASDISKEIHKLYGQMSVVIEPVAKEIIKLIDDNPNMTRAQINTILSTIPDPFYITELRTYYNSKHAAENCYKMHYIPGNGGSNESI